MENYIIVGNGAAGYYSAGTIRKNNPSAIIKLISAEKELTYYRPLLSDYIAQDIDDKKFFLSPAAWYTDNNIDLILGRKVTKVNTAYKNITLEDGSVLSYDKLILANGSSNFIPPIKGSNLDGVYTLKYKSDAECVKAAMKNAKKAVVIGGGVLGLEAAWEMKNSGLDVTVVEFFPRLLPRQLDDKAAELFKSMADKSGITLILGDSADEILSDESSNKVTGLKLKSGKELRADLVLFSVGIRPNKALAEEAGIACSKGIIVNENMETSAKDVYACGDVAEFNEIVYGNWTSAIEMGKTAGKNASGEESKFKQFVASIIFKALNIDLFSVGTIDFNDVTLKAYTQEDRDKGIYKKLFFKDNVFSGAILMGDTKKAVKVLTAMKQGADESIVDAIFQ